MQFYRAHSEWEAITEGEVITHLSLENGYYIIKPTSEITFHRNDEYKLQATLTGVVDNKGDLEHKANPEIGSFVSSEVIYGYGSKGLSRYKINGVVIASCVFSYDPNFEMPKSRFKSELIFDSIEKFPYEDRADISENLNEWFISAKKNHVFPRTTTRILKKRTFKQREGVDAKDDDRVPTIEEGSATDFLVVDVGEFKVVLSSVPREFGPTWSENICIEYRNSFGKIPDTETRKGISEFVGFMFGTELIKIGHTYYDVNMNPIAEHYSNLYGSLRDKIGNSSKRPVNLPQFISEDIFNNLMPKYLKLRQKYNLDGIFEKYWLAKRAHMGINLPMLSSCLDTLADCFFHEHKIDSQYINYHDFVELVNEELEKISEKLAMVANKDEIMKNIKGAASMGRMGRIRAMFERLGLELGSVEIKALKERHKMAHSAGIVISDEEVSRMAKMTGAYFTTLHRLILKLLDYEGNCMDYYNYKEMDIKSAISNGNKKKANNDSKMR